MVSRGNTVVVEVDGDTAGYKRALASAGEQTQKFASSAGSTFASQFGVVALGAGAAMAAVEAARLVGSEMRAAVSAASDMAESQSKLDQVFGDSSERLKSWANTAATTMGMSRQAATEAAGTFGNFTQSLGLSRDEAAKMSPALVQLAADLASFNNANPEEVLLALRSGLSGEAEPLRRFGVALSAAQVENAALQLGLVKTKDEITEGIKVQARYALILDQTKLAQGDYARTSDGLANQQRTLNAQWDDMREKIGTALLPLVLDLTSSLNDLLEKHGDEWAKDFATAVDTTTASIGLLIEKVSALDGALRSLTGSGIGGWFENLAETMLTSTLGPAGPALLGLLRGEVQSRVDETEKRRQIEEIRRKFGGAALESDAEGSAAPPKPGPRLGSGGGGSSGAAGPKPTAFSPATIGLMDQILSGLPQFQTPSLDAAGLEQYRQAEREFAAVRKRINRDLAELGLQMAGLDARGLENSDTFKALQDRSQGLKSTLEQIDMVQDLRLGQFKDSMELVADSVDRVTEAGRRFNEESQQWFRSQFQQLAQSGTRFSAQAFGVWANASGMRTIDQILASGGTITQDDGSGPRPVEVVPA